MQEIKKDVTPVILTRRSLFATIGKSVAAMGLFATTGISLFAGKKAKVSVTIHPDAIQRKTGREG